MLVAQKNMRSGDAVTINYSAPFYAASRYLRISQKVFLALHACHLIYDLV